MTRFTHRLVILSLVVAMASSQLFADGVEIGNGKRSDGRGGFEIGNGSILTVPGLYTLNEVIGNWKVESHNQFIRLTAMSDDAIKTQGDIDILRMVTILTGNDLMAYGNTRGWKSFTNLRDIQGIKKDSVSMSGMRVLEIMLYRAPTEVIRVNLSGPAGDPGFSAFEKFQKTLESLELTPTPNLG